ncbi:MAG: S24 family peptidase [Acidobacteria bacterium]|nr:S24 family peptidase [Acidobacteriota bacterium]
MAGYAYVPHYRLEGATGGGDLVEETGPDCFLAFGRQWVEQRLRTVPEGLRVIRADDDAMAPTILRGDALLVDTGQCPLVDGGVYLVRHAGEAQVRRLFSALGSRVRILPDNPQFSPAEGDRAGDAFGIVGRVLWIGRML